MASGIGMLPPDPVFCFKENFGHIHCLNFPKRNPDYCDLLLAGTEAGDVCFLDLESNRMQHKQKMGESIQAIHSIEYDIITQEKSGLVKLWAIENNTGYRTQKAFHSYGGFCKSVMLDNQLIIAQENSTLSAIDLDTFESTRKFTPTETENSAVFLGNAMCLEPIEIKGTKYLLVGYESGELVLYDFATAKKCCQIKCTEFITSVTFDPLHCRGVISNSSNRLQLFGLNVELHEFTLHAELALPNEGCSIVKFRPDKKLFVAGTWDAKLRVYSWKTLRVLAILKDHKKQISDIQFSPNVVRNWSSKIFATAGADGMVALWNVYHNFTY